MRTLRALPVFSNPDVFIPQLGRVADKLPHEFDALLVIDHLQVDASAAHVIFGAAEGFVFSDDDARNLVK